MSKLYLNAPIQNTEFNPDLKLGKVIPIFVAQSIRGSEDTDMPRIDLWNNVLSSQQTGHTPDSYEDTANDRLNAKYDSAALSWLASQSSEPALMTDTSPEFMSWAEGIITTSLETGDLQIKKIAAYVCNSCDATIAAAAGPTPDCGNCPDAAVSIESKESLVAEITDEAINLALHMADTHSDPSLFNSARQLQKRSFIANKRRITGISLENLGFEGDILDPRIGVGLLATYAATTTNSQSVGVIAARANQFHNLPQFAAAIKSQHDDIPELSMIAIAKAPINYIQHLIRECLLTDETAYHTLLHRIAPRLPMMRKDMTPETASNLIFSRKHI